MIPVSPRRRRSQGGNYIMEMGLCMIVLCYLIFGIVEYSNLNYANNFCAFAAQQGARYASIRGATSVNPLPTSPSPCGTSCTNETTGDPTTTYVQGLAIGLSTSNLTVTTNWSGAVEANANDVGGTVTVKVAYSYSPLLKIVTPGVSMFSLSSTSSMTVIQ